MIHVHSWLDLSFLCVILVFRIVAALRIGVFFSSHFVVTAFFPCGLSSVAIYKILCSDKICQQIILWLQLYCSLFSCYSQKYWKIYAIVCNVFHFSCT